MISTLYKVIIDYISACMVHHVVLMGREQCLSEWDERSLSVPIGCTLQWEDDTNHVTKQLRVILANDLGSDAIA
jgi:hypothetical protein